MEVGEDATNNTGYWAYNANPNYYTPNDLRHSTADAWATPLNDDNSLTNDDSCRTPPLMPPWAGGGEMLGIFPQNGEWATMGQQMT